jgi:hypothetical protein
LSAAAGVCRSAYGAMLQRAVGGLIFYAHYRVVSFHAPCCAPLLPLFVTHHTCAMAGTRTARREHTSLRAGMSSVGSSGGAPGSPGGGAVGAGEARRAEVYKAGATDAHVVVHVRQDSRPPAGEHGGTSSRSRTVGAGAGAAHSMETQQAPPAAAPHREDKALAEAMVRAVWPLALAGPQLYTQRPQLYATTS